MGPGGGRPLEARNVKSPRRTRPGCAPDGALVGRLRPVAPEGNPGDDLEGRPSRVLGHPRGAPGIEVEQLSPYQRQLAPRSSSGAMA
jgi:hypothetical protein